MTKPKLKPKTDKAVVLLSGGIDSAVALAVAIKDGCEEIFPISIQYGQKHQARELESALSVVSYYNQKSTEQAETGDISNGIAVVHLLKQYLAADLFEGSTSALMDPNVDQLKLPYAELSKLEGPAQTVVPFRNANLISIATTYAILNDANLVYVGVHASDASRYAYPDCTPEFIGAMANAVSVGSYYEVRLRAPLQYLTKAEVVDLGRTLHVPLSLTYSCYAGGELHCGTCPTCIERIEAFQQNQWEDFADYEISITWPQRPDRLQMIRSGRDRNQGEV